MNVSAISKSRIDRVIQSALNIWRRYSIKDLRNRLSEIWGDKFLPIYEFDATPLTCAIFGSGSFTTGRFEIYIARVVKDELGWVPIKHTLIVTNSAGSRAKDVASEFELPIVEIDFKNWYKTSYNPSSSYPIRETSLFVDLPSTGEIEERFNIRAEFDKAILNEIEKITELPQLISLRGYNFPIMYSLLDGGYRLIDDTHPADLSITDKQGVPIFPGWQVGAVKKMIDCGIQRFRGSLIEVKPFFSTDDVTSLDTGQLFALTPGIKPPSSWDTKKIQIIMKRTEDYFLCALKGSGLFPYLWGMSKIKDEVEYLTKEGKAVRRIQPSLIVGSQIRCGKNAFGRDIKDVWIDI